MVKETILILGSGTLGKLVVDILDSSNIYDVGGFYSDDYALTNSVLGYPVLGRLSDVNNIKTTKLAIGIGEPKFRKQLHEKLSTQGHVFPPIIHNNVVVSKYCDIAPGVIIGPNSSVLNGSRIGAAACLLSHVNINQDVVVEPYCLIAAGVVVGNSATLCEGCHIGLGSYIKLRQTVPPWTSYN